jgi:ERF superfamily
MKSLAKKMVAVMKAVDAVEKSGKNEKQGYRYVKATDVAREVRNALIQNGIAFGYSIEKTERWTQPTISGGTLNFIEMWGNVTFADMEADETVTYQGVGWGMDSGDKAPYKAMTGLLKYVLRMNFMIPDELDPENDSAEPRAANGSGKEIIRKSEKSQIGIAANGEPIWDENGDPVVERLTLLTQQLQASINQRQQQTSQVPNMLRAVPGKQVGIPRGKRWFAIGMAAGRTKEELNNYLGSIGVERSEEIPVNLYEHACEWAAGQ